MNAVYNVPWYQVLRVRVWQQNFITNKITVDTRLFPREKQGKNKKKKQ